MRHKLDYFINCNISDDISANTFKLGMTVDSWIYMLMLVSMTLTLMQDHSGSANANNQRCMLSATEQAISFELAATPGHFPSDLDLDFANVYMACPHYFCFSLLRGLQL